MDTLFLYLFYLGSSMLCALIGSSKGRNGFLVFLAAVFLTPILTLIYILAVPKNALSSGVGALDEQTGGDIACPTCAETIKRAAKVCRFCGFDLQTYQASQAKSSDSEERVEQRFERWLREQNPPVVDPQPETRAELKRSFLWRLNQGEISD